MKSPNNKLSETAEVIKQALTTELAKNGHSLYDLESAISTQDLEKTAALVKSGEGILASLAALLSLGKGGLLLGAGTAGGVGALGGGALYGAYKGIQDSQKKVDDADAVKQRINLARYEIEQAMRGNQ